MDNTLQNITMIQGSSRLSQESWEQDGMDNLRSIEVLLAAFVTITLQAVQSSLVATDNPLTKAETHGNGVPLT
jgi:hypothetical protein